MTGIKEIKTARDFLVEKFGDFNQNHPLSHLGYAKNLEPDIADIINVMDEFKNGEETVKLMIPPHPDLSKSVEKEQSNLGSPSFADYAANAIESMTPKEQSEVELLKNQIKEQNEKIMGYVLQIDSILETNRKLGERITELESPDKIKEVFCNRLIARIKELESQSKKAIDWCDEKVNEAKLEMKQGYRDDTLQLLTQMKTDYTNMKLYLLSLSNINK